MKDPDRYLRLRGGKWHYVRRVPTHAVVHVERARIEISLKTGSLDTARIRRDAMEEADDRYWASLIADVPSDAAGERYKSDKARCLALGFTWRSMASLVSEGSDEEIVSRVLALSRAAGMQPTSALARDANAVLGTAEAPSPKISRVVEIYLSEIAQDALRRKSKVQKANYEKMKRRAASNFIKVAGDKPIGEINREDALAYRAWWADRVNGSGKDKRSPETASRDIGDMNTIYAGYYRHIGEEHRSNPFRELQFKLKPGDTKDRPPFPTEWITDRILRRDSFERMNLQAGCILLTMVETGCRPSELCNIPAERIHLEAPVPHIEIEFQDERELKTRTSIRKIPLVGVALAAMKLCPKGFPRYRDKENGFSAMALKHFRKHGLFPTPDHVIYSFRHSFEKRMMEGGLDPELRKRLFGHGIDREEYGDGGSLGYRREQLLKIVLPYPDDVFDGLRRGR
ncbi:DUF6538 domain-containing protein [Roseibium sediminis]|uniref:DUF6538 domain-containing protein n=1 Tax=Roseibium sediminis TaxID=1775174 RepID=UPI00123CECA9|nr:DUF6538 domain-containing protein [Roseibium sediminis]